MAEGFRVGKKVCFDVVVVSGLMLCLVLIVTVVVPNVTMNLAVIVTPAHISQADNAALSRTSRRRLQYSCRPPSPSQPVHRPSHHPLSHLYLAYWASVSLTGLWRIDRVLLVLRRTWNSRRGQRLGPLCHLGRRRRLLRWWDRGGELLMSWERIVRLPRGEG